MKLYIPACGDRVTLAAPWSFHLYLEHRNVDFAKTMKLVDPAMRRWDGGHGAGLKRVEAALPAGTVIECDRVYIRGYNKSRLQADEDYDSITWKVMKPNGKAAPKSRFWVKLTDCNQIEYGDVFLYRDFVKLPKLIMES